MEDSGSEKFCLSWNDFHSNFISEFEALKEEEDFVDVTLYCQGRCIKAHKVVLSACSFYLKNIFKEHPGKHPIIILDNVSYNNLAAVIQFVYTGQVCIEMSELSSFLKAAETLQIKGLFESATNQSLIKDCKTDLQDCRVKISKKREANLDHEVKKGNKRKLVRITSSEQKENTEVKDDTKDFSFQINESQAGNANFILNSVNRINEKFECDTRRLDESNAVEDYAPGDGKKAHWLDPRSCPLCNKVYSNLSNLRQHMKIMHNPTLVTCKLCYKTFKTDLYLRRHLISFHALGGSGSELVPVEAEKADQTQPLIWNPSIKSETVSFEEMLSNSEIYQHHQ